MLVLRKTSAGSDAPPPGEPAPHPAGNTPPPDAPAPVARSTPEDILLIAWLDGQFSAQVAHRGVPGRAWRRQTSAQSPAEFRGALAEAVRQTGFQGRSVSLLLAHDALAPSRVECPAHQRVPLNRFVRDQVERLNPFPGTVPVWAFRPASTETQPGSVNGWLQGLLGSIRLARPKSKRSGILYILSRTLHDDIVEACRHAGLMVRQIIPVTEALLHHSGSLPLESDRLYLIASAWEEGTAVALVRKHGFAELVRILDEPSEQSSKAVVDFIQSHLHFAENILRQSITAIHLFGGTTSRIAPEIRAAAHGLPVDVHFPDADRTFWTETLLRLGVHHPVNLVTLEIRKAPTRRIVRRTMAWVGASTVAVSIGLAALAEQHAGHALQQIIQSEGNIIQLSRRLGNLKQEVAILENQWNLVLALPPESLDPVPLWFLAHLGEVTPRDIWLNRVVINARTNDWTVLVSAQQQPHAGISSVEEIKRLSQELKNQLTAGPLAIQIQQDKSFGSALGEAQLSPRLPQQLGSIIRSATGRPMAPRQFIVEGTLR